MLSTGDTAVVDELRRRIPEVSALCERYHVRELHLFGSATSASSLSEVRDLDFLVTFKQMPPALHAESYFGLAESLSGMFSLHIDLVEADAIRNPFFRESVEERKEAVYGVA